MKKSNSSRNPKNPASLLSDECVPEIVNKFLENNNITVYRPAGLELTSQPDEIVFEKANQLKLPIITLDIRFVGQIYREKSYINGLILLRYKGKVTNNLLLSIKKFLEETALDQIQNCIVVIDEVKYRISKKNF
ncbi:hypothetical protein A3A60_00970 [Candidatus Curtissbacteria bacterium RIFCSPLOWO2_01_FULL_42_26]|uniref:DUF5615 domain-containing protein n=1 Tax=Candidatus Curtissbacteria bacterium RIFCSPLOWO2_01_FULL_42_26 TaxID=1797729 RepID=A0A1F5HY66_9BACT|nr:MAG: hypothetical protein A3A60_00970 [Candidatus Curtissbacteria bacterium RIFCSPLOWO2_01_FULL_42_26]